MWPNTGKRAICQPSGTRVALTAQRLGPACPGVQAGRGAVQQHDRQRVGLRALVAVVHELAFEIDKLRRRRRPAGHQRCHRPVGRPHQRNRECRQHQQDAEDADHPADHGEAASGADAVAWFFSVAVLFVLYRREFHSDVLVALQDGLQA